MNRQTLKRLMAKGIMAYVAVFSLVLMVAMPALALMANSVGTREIKNHSIRSADIRNKAVTTDRIAPRAVKRGKIGKRAIRTEHINYISDSKIRYSTKTKVLSISAQALNPTHSDYIFNKTNGYLSSGTASTFSAPVYLPNGAVITGFKADLYDDSPVNYTNASLRRWRNTTVDTMAEVTTIGSISTSGWRVFSDTDGISFATIKNTSHAYYVRGYFSGSSVVAIGRIVITYRTASP